MAQYIWDCVNTQCPAASRSLIGMVLVRRTNHKLSSEVADLSWSFIAHLLQLRTAEGQTSSTYVHENCDSTSRPTAQSAKTPAKKYPNMPTILTAGVSVDWIEQANARGVDTGERNQKRNIDPSIQKFKEDLQNLQNTTIETTFLKPGDTAYWNEFVAKVKSKKWDGITLGGVRTIPKLGDYFTELVHLAIREQPQATLMFPLLPEDIVPAVRKYVPGAD